MEGLANKLRTDLKEGLSESEIRENFETRRLFYGDNIYPQKPRKTFLSLWWEACQDTTIIILCLAALISLLIGIFAPAEEGEDQGHAWIEGLAILIAVLLVTIVTAVNEYQQEGQFRELNKVKEDKYVFFRLLIFFFFFFFFSVSSIFFFF